MKKLVIMLLASICVAVACKKSDDIKPPKEPEKKDTTVVVVPKDTVPPPPPPPPVPLLDTVYRSDNGKSYTLYTFKFNSDSTLFSMNSWNATNVTSNALFFYYTAGKKPYYAAYSPTGNIKDTMANSFHVFRTNAIGLPYLTYPADYNERDSLVYNEKKQLVAMYTYHLGRIRFIDTLVWAGNNISSEVLTYYENGGVNEVVKYSYKYDDKINAYAMVRTSQLVGFGMNSWFSENNLTEYLSESSLYGNMKITYQHQYNDKKFPVSTAVTIVTNNTYVENFTDRYVYKN